MAESALLTRLDVSDGEYAKDATHELHRAGSDPARLSVWALRWGTPLTSRCEEVAGWDQAPDDVEEAEAAATKAEERSTKLTDAIEAAVKAFERGPFADLPDATFGALDQIFSDLEAAL
jgi:hypothetical protein